MNYNILFFDGTCHLCNGYINFLSRFKPKTLYYAPLQGTTAQKILSPQDLKQLNSIVFYKNGKILKQSAAVIESLYETSPWFFWIRLFYVIPRFARNKIYDYIAENRYQWFGKTNSCRLPTAEERSHLLD